MAPKKVKKAESKAEPVEPKLRNFTLSLSDLPSNLHRAGLAGLWMALKALKLKNGKLNERQISWELGPESISLNWECTDQEALSSILSATYQLDDNGVILVNPLRRWNTVNKIAFHQGITSTFLQHSLVVKSLGMKTERIPIEGDDPNQDIEVRYKNLLSYSHQNLDKYFDKKGYLPEAISIVSWLYPGGGVLHNAFGDQTKLQATPTELIALVFAPIACQYFSIKSRLKQSKFLWALVIPFITNLEQFGNTYPNESNLSNFSAYYASGLSDAGFQYLRQIIGNSAWENFGIDGCEIWLFGQKGWSKQAVITDKQTINLKDFSRPTWRCYALAHQTLANGYKIGKNGTFIDLSFGREIVAENLYQEKNWYANLHHVFRLSTDDITKLSSEGGKLFEMKETMIAESPDKSKSPSYPETFGDVFTWLIYQLFMSKASNTRPDEKANFKRVREDLQISIRGVRTQEQFLRWWRVLNTKVQHQRNPFLYQVDIAKFYQWVKDNWEECLDLAALTVLSYRNPWKVERTQRLLLDLGLKLPKNIDEYPDDLYDEDEEKSTFDSDISTESDLDE